MPKVKRKGGRPARSKQKAKHAMLIRLTKAEHAALSKAAKPKPLATWAREVLLREAGR